MIAYLFLWLGLMYLDTVQPHAIYISVIDIKHEESKEEASLVIKVFTNDFEDVLYNHSNLPDRQAGKRLQLSKADVCNSNKEIINTYFEKHLQMHVNGKSMVYRFESCEINDDSIWVTFSMTCAPDWDNFNIRADYFMELFPAQTNVVNLLEGGEKRFLKLTMDQKEDRIDF